VAHSTRSALLQGPDVAVQLLVAAGDNTDRIRSDAALAKLCGACPIPAGSGKTNG